jgi:phage-related protein
VAAPAILKIDIIADATKAAAALKETGDAGQGVTSKMGALGKAVAGGMAVGAVVAFGKASVGAAMESEVATARLDQVFRSMGDTTGKAAKEAEAYASVLSKKIGVDDDAIKAAQAQLATFGAVSNETARAAGIFDRTTAAAADLAAAGFGTLDSNAVQLGKALQDPVKGLAALGKSGVTFTEEQKAMIAGMVESGDLLGAQQVVLKAVEGQVKGTAEATATSSDKMTVAFGETQEAVGAALLPVLEKLLPLLTKLAGFIERNISWILPLAAAFGVLAVAWNIASVAATLFGTSMLAALWPVLLIIAAIAAIVAIVYLLITHWDTIKAAAAAVWAAIQVAWDAILAVIQGVWDGIKAGADAVWQAIQTAFDAILGVVRKVWDWISANWPTLLAILTGPIGLAVLLIVRHWDTIRDAILAVWNWIKSTWNTLVSILTQPFESAALIIKAAIDRVRGIISGAWDFISGIVTSITDAITGIPGKIGDIGARVAGMLKNPINTIIRGWNNISISIPKVSTPFGDIGGGKIDFPNIPELARGGAVTRTGLALVHAGETFSGVGKTLGGSTVINVNVTTTGLGADAPEIQRSIVNALRGHVARNGPLDVPVRSTDAA